MTEVRFSVEAGSFLYGIDAGLCFLADKAAGP